MTQKDIHKIFIPQKIFIFLKTLKGIEIQNLEPQNGASPHTNENIIVPHPHPLHPLLADRNRGRGVQTQITEKNSDKGVFCCCVFATIFFLRFKRVETFIGGGGGGGGGGKGCNVLLLLFYYFFFWGGGGANPYFYRNLYNLCFFGGGGGGGGGGVRTTYPSLDSRIGKK